MRIKKLKYSLILLIFISALISSTILAFAPLSKVCGTNPGEGCNLVQNTSYSKTFGINNGYYGFIIFLTLSIITLIHLKKPTLKSKKAIEYSIIIGSIISIYFIYLQFSIINAFCKFCMIIDTGMVLSLGIILFWKD